MDAVARELERGTLDEWRGEGLARRRAWHLVSRAGEDLPGTAALFLDHLCEGIEGAGRFHRVGVAAASASS